MENIFNSSSLLCHSVLLLFLIPFLPSAKPINTTDYTTLLYKSCANQTRVSPTGSHSRTLSTLFQELVSHSLQSKFFRTAIEGDNETAILGLFQCRPDISNEDCGHCVNALPGLSSSLCKESMAARIHLYGCYMRYEPEGFPEAPLKHHELVYKSCEEAKQAVVPAGTLEAMTGRAFAALESGIADSGDGLYKTKFESVEVMGQCEGDLEGCVCEACVTLAVHIANEQCGGAVSGQIYLDKCFVSFSYHPKEKKSDKKKSNNNGRTVAIVVGGAAALSLGYLLLLFIKSWTKRDED